MTIQKGRIAALALLCALGGAGGALAQTTNVTTMVAPSLNYGQIGTNSLSLVGLSGPTANSPLSFSVNGVSGGITFSGNSTLKGVASGNPYVAGTSGAVTIDFATTQKFFGMRWGSVDTSNVLSFYNNDQLVYSMTGAQANAAAGGPTSGYGFNAAFNFAELGYNKVVAFDATNVAAFEVRDMKFSENNVQVAPIPLNAASLGGMLSFLLLLGSRSGRLNVRVALGSILPLRHPRMAHAMTC